MFSFKTKKNIFLKLFLLFAILIVGIVLLIGFTKPGITYLTKSILNSLVDKKEVSWKNEKGNIISDIEYENLVLKDLKQFAFPNSLQIQLLKFGVNSLSLNGLSVDIINGKLSLPEAEPILFYGSLDKGNLDYNIFTKAISEKEVEKMIDRRIAVNLSARVVDLDVYLKGLIRNPSVSGSFIVDKARFKEFFFEKASCDFDLILKKVDDKISLYGAVDIKDALVRGKKTALVRLENSKIIFNGDVNRPEFNINATSVVNKVKINISLKGSFQNPLLKVSSNPFMPQGQLLLALATNKMWKATQDLMVNGSLSPAVAADFIGYFIFGAKDDNFFKKLGLKDVSFVYDENVRGVEVKKDLSDKLEGKYGIEQKNKVNGETEILQKVGGEYKVTDNIAIGAERGITAEKTSSNIDQDEPAVEDKVTIEFKRSF